MSSASEAIMEHEGMIGKVALIRYRGGAKGEEPVDDRSTGEPLAVMIGSMQLPKGIEDAVAGMVAGERKMFEIPCEAGYGERQEKLASWYPKAMLDDGYGLNVGDVVFWTNPDDNRKMPVWVTDTTPDAVKLDFNHPFAGKTLEYWIELVDWE